MVGKLSYATEPRHQNVLPRREDKGNLSRGHGEDRESWTRGMTCKIWAEL